MTAIKTHKLTWAQCEWLCRVLAAGPDGLDMRKITRHERSFANAAYAHNAGTAMNSPLPRGSKVMYRSPDDDRPSYIVVITFEDNPLVSEAYEARLANEDALRQLGFTITNLPASR